MNRFSKLAIIASLTIVSSRAAQAVVVVNDFGAGNWKSWDTRDNTGVRLLGTANSHPGWPGGAYSSANDPLIEEQIKFMGEGQTVADDAGGTPDPSPVGSLNGQGYVRLDGTNNNRGKSDISYITGSTIASPAALLAPDFYAEYRYYPDSNASSRTPGLNIGMLNGSGLEYIFNHVQVPYSADSWNTELVNNTTSLFSLYGIGAPGGGTSKTLLDWSTDPTWGSVIFGDTTNAIMRVGFNIGSSQRNSLTYLDWMSTSLMGGELNDFQAEAVVPEPASVAIWSLLGASALVAHRRSRKKS